MDDGIEELAIFPAGGEVITPQAMVALYHPLRPQKQLFFGSHIIWLTVHLDIGDLMEPRKTVKRSEK